MTDVIVTLLALAVVVVWAEFVLSVCDSIDQAERREEQGDRDHTR